MVIHSQVTNKFGDRLWGDLWFLFSTSSYSVLRSFICQICRSVFRDVGQITSNAMSYNMTVALATYICHHTLKRKCRHFDKIFVRWRKFCQNDDISVSIYVRDVSFRRCPRGSVASSISVLFTCPHSPVCPRRQILYPRYQGQQRLATTAPENYTTADALSWEIQKFLLNHPKSLLSQHVWRAR